MGIWIETAGGRIEISDAGHVNGAPLDPPDYQPSGTVGLVTPALSPEEPMSNEAGVAHTTYIKVAHKTD